MLKYNLRKSSPPIRYVPWLRDPKVPHHHIIRDVTFVWFLPEFHFLKVRNDNSWNSCTFREIFHAYVCRGMRWQYHTLFFFLHPNHIPDDAVLTPLPFSHLCPACLIRLIWVTSSDPVVCFRNGEVEMVESLRLIDAQEGIDAFLKKRKPNWVHTEEQRHWMVN